MFFITKKSAKTTFPHFFDFPHFLRDDVFIKLYQKWPGMVARISNHVYYGEKSAIREAIRKLGYRHRIAKNALNTLALTSIYTLGHFCIATFWASFIFNVSLSEDALDAIIEPILNGFWFFFLHSLWKKHNI